MSTSPSREHDEISLANRSSTSFQLSRSSIDTNSTIPQDPFAKARAAHRLSGTTVVEPPAAHRFPPSRPAVGSAELDKSESLDSPARARHASHLSCRTFVEYEQPAKDKDTTSWAASNTKLETSEEKYPGSGTEEDPYVVSFARDDPTDPQNFSVLKKWIILLTVGSATLCVAFGSSIYVGGVTGIALTFGKGETLVLCGVSFYVGGFAFGPMVWAPSSELFGRKPIFLLTFAPFFLFQIGCALAQNIETLLICRLLAGTIGSSPLTNSAGVIVDTFTAAQRGPAMALYALLPFLGPVIGPIIGAYVGEQSLTSFRWLFWIMTIFSFICLVAGCFVPETYAPVILRKRAASLSKKHGKCYKSAGDVAADGVTAVTKESVAAKVKTSMLRPFVLLFKEPIVFLFALYASVIYGILYLMFGAFPVVYSALRGFSAGSAGLPFIAVGIGMFFGIVGAVIDSIRYTAKLRANGGKPLAPEERLGICCIGGIMLPISLAWFAASCRPDVHWIVPVMSGAPFGCGMLLVFLGGSSYLVDTYTNYAASAMAANSFMRSLFGAAFPLFTLQLFRGLGAPWALGLLAFVTLFCAPIPFLFKSYGARIRGMSSYSPSGMPSPPASDATLELGLDDKSVDRRPSVAGTAFPVVEHRKRPNLVSPFPTWPKEKAGEIWFDARADPW